ncbi:MAG: acyl carrier protein [Beijerinckiaceae bacterium]|nr:acyl carrier protein [Beijerinckiaceae bacterium]
MSGLKSALIEQRIVQFIHTELHVDVDDIDPDVYLGDFGLGSVAAVKLIGILEDAFSARLSPTLVFEHPTIAALSKVVEEIASRAAAQRR